VLGITLSDLFAPLTLSLKPLDEHRANTAPRPTRRPLR
jgi:hypothetical protein